MDVGGREIEVVAFSVLANSLDGLLHCLQIAVVS